VSQGSVLSTTLYDTSQTPGFNLAPFADDMHFYSTDLKEAYVLRKMQSGLTSMESWCESWNVKTNDDKIQSIYFFSRQGPVKSRLILNG